MYFVIKIFLLLVFLFILILLILSIYFVKKLLKDKINSVKFTIEDGLKKGEFGSNLLKYKKIHFYYKSDFGYKIYGQIFPGNINRVIFFVHGVTWTLYGMYKYILPFINNNWTCVLIDLKGHGKSGSFFPTYGYLEKKDLAKLINYIVESFKYCEHIFKNNKVLNNEENYNSKLKKIDKEIKRKESNKITRFIKKEELFFKKLNVFFDKELFIYDIFDKDKFYNILKNFSFDDYTSNKKICFGIFGESMGASIAAQTINYLIYKPNFIILDSVFSSLRELALFNLKKTLKIKLFVNLIYFISRIIIKLIAGFDIEKIFPQNDLTKEDVPLLMIHSKYDTLVPSFMPYRIYRKRIKKSLVTYLEFFDSKEHARSIYNDENRYWDSIFDFISKFY